MKEYEIIYLAYSGYTVVSYGQSSQIEYSFVMEYNQKTAHQEFQEGEAVLVEVYNPSGKREYKGYILLDKYRHIVWTKHIVDVVNPHPDRTARLLFQYIITPVMTSNNVWLYKKTGGVIDCDLEDPDDADRHDLLRYTGIFASASSYKEEGFEAYQAFRQNTDFGWLSGDNDVEGAWIQINPGRNYRYPFTDVTNPDKATISYYDAHNNFLGGAYAIGILHDPIRVDVYNSYADDAVCKKFTILGSYDGETWEAIRTCNVEDVTPKHKNSFVIHLPEDVDEYNYKHEGYALYRIRVDAGVNAEQTRVGFSCINFYGMSDHDEFTFRQNSRSGINVPCYYERLYMINEENGCDGYIWDRVHEKNLILSSQTYSYTYSGYADLAIIHPNEQHINCVTTPINMDPSLAALTRSKNYVIYQWNYYNYYGNYDPAGRPMYVSKDGIRWKKTDGIHSFDGYTSNWSPKADVGLIFGLAPRDSRLSDNFQYQINKLEIERDGSVRQTYLGHYKIDFPENLKFCGDVMLKDEGDGHTYWTAYDHDGRRYTTALPRTYTYQDGSQIRTTTFSYNFYVMGGKYVAAARRIVGYNSYWRYTYEIFLSDNGFETVQVYDLAPSWTDGSDWSYRVMYFDDHWLCYRYSSQNNWYYVRTFTSDFSGYSDGALVSSSEFDLQGQFTQHNDNVQSLILKIGYRESPTPGQYQKLVSLDGYAYPEINRMGCGRSTVYIKNGKVSDPFDYMVLPLDYSFGDWDADYITYFLFKGDFTSDPGNKMCFTSKNPMIDPNNPTWKHWW